MTHLLRASVADFPRDAGINRWRGTPAQRPLYVLTIRIVAITVAYTGTKYRQTRTGSTRTAYGPTTDAGNAPSHSQGSRRQSTAAPSVAMTKNVMAPAVEANPSDIVVIAT